MLQRGDFENVMEFLEVLAGDPNILKNNGYLSSIIAFMTNHKTKLDPIPFKGQLDTIEWLQGIAQKLKEGTMSKQDIIDAQNALKDRIKVTKENLQGNPEGRFLGFPVTIPAVTGAVGGIAGTRLALQTSSQIKKETVVDPKTKKEVTYSFGLIP